MLAGNKRDLLAVKAVYWRHEWELKEDGRLYYFNYGSPNKWCLLSYRFFTLRRDDNKSMPHPCTGSK